MTTAVSYNDSFDTTGLPNLLRGLTVLAIVQAVCVLATSLVERNFAGVTNRGLTAVIVAFGATFTIFYPGTRTRPRTIEGIAGAAAIGLGATWAFMVLDLIILQPLHTYTDRWYQVGGGANWWYIPAWWLVGTYLSWMGGFILAHLGRRTGRASVPLAVTLLAVLTAICGAGGAWLGFPGAGWNVPTFAIAIAPALLLENLLTWLVARRA
jgi:hypothetical protein